MIGNSKVQIDDIEIVVLFVGLYFGCKCAVNRFGCKGVLLFRLLIFCLTIHSSGVIHGSNK